MRRARWPRHAPSLLLASSLCFLTPAARSEVWTRPLPVTALAGAGDVLAAATMGGVVLWDLSSRTAHVVTTAQGLPSHIVLAASLAPELDELDVATDNGIAKGWFDGPWEARGQQLDEEGAPYYACMPRPGGGFVAGGELGQLVAWHHGRVDSLRVPTRSGRVVGLDRRRDWTDAGTNQRPAAGLAAAPAFPAGLVAALDNDGVWLLRTSGSWTRWLHIDADRDGLPSPYTRAVLADPQGFVWVATVAGVARVGPDLDLRTFPADSLLSRRANVFLAAPDGFLYVGLDNGLARVENADGYAPRATRVPGPTGAVVALAWADARLWWSDGERVQSLAGDALVWPASLAANYCLEVHASRDTIWVGHPFGEASLRAGSAGPGSTWVRLGAANGLPLADVHSFLHVGEVLYIGTGAGLYVQSRGGIPELHRVASADEWRFVRVDEVPDAVSAQAFAQGLHWAGGPAGLSRREAPGWTRVELWPGASAVVDLASSGDTLWASAGHGGIAYDTGSGWVQPGRTPDLAGIYFGRLSAAAAGRLAVATDRGLVLWDGSILQRAAGTPDVFLTDVAWWESRVACGSYRGLWMLESAGAWNRLGVTDGLPGAQILGLATGTAGDLWIAATRGLGRLPTRGGGRPMNPILPAPSPAAAHLRLAVGSTARGDGTEFEPIRIYDVRGRLVRSLDSPPERVEWSARDPAGHRVGSGIYFAAVRRPSGALMRSGRILVLR